MTRTVTGTIRHLDDTTWIGAVVEFESLSTLIVSGVIYPPEVKQAITGAGGTFSVALEVPASGTALHRVRTPWVNQVIALAAGPSVDLSTLLTIPLTPAEQDELQTLLDTHTSGYLHSEFNVLSFGAYGDATANELAHDDSAAIQAAFDAAAASGHGTVLFPPAGGYAIKSTLYIRPATGQTEANVDIVCQDKYGICSQAGDNISMIVTKGWKNSRAQGVTLATVNDSVIGWDITDPPEIGSSSHITWDACTVLMYGHNDKGWRGGALDSVGADVSFLTFVNCRAIGWPAYQDSIGWNICHSNCLNWTWHGGYGVYLGTMVKSETGIVSPGGASMFTYGLGATHNLCEFSLDAAGPWSIFGGRFEVGKRFLECGDYDGANGYPMNITVNGAEISQYTPDDGVLFMIGTPGSLVLDNVDVSYTDVATDWDARMITLGGSTDGYGSLIVRGGSVKTASAADPFYTIGRGHWTARIEDVQKVNGSGVVIGKYTNTPALPTIREVLTAARTYYVRTDGSDTNDGKADTAGGAFLTTQHAIDVVATLDSSIYDVTIRVAAGTYVENLITCKNMVGSGSIIIDGDSSSTTIIDGGFNNSSAGAKYILQHLKLIKNSSSNGVAMSASGGGIILFLDVDFGTGFTTHIIVGENGSITATGAYTISGGATYHLNPVSTGVFNAQSITITVVDAPVFTIFVLAQDLGFVRVYGLTFSGSAAGMKYYITTNAVIQTFGASVDLFPGSTPGATDATGVYA